MIIEKLELNLDSDSEEYITLSIIYKYKDKILCVNTSAECPAYDELQDVLRDNYIKVVATKYNNNYLYGDLICTITDYLNDTCVYEDDDEESETYGLTVPNVGEIEDILYDFKRNTQHFVDIIKSIQNGDSNNNIDQLTLLP